MTVSRVRQSRFVLWSFVFLLVLHSFGLSAQEGRTVIPVSLTSSEIVVSQPWRQESALSQETADREVVILSGTNDNVIIGFMPAANAGSDPITTVLGDLAESLEPLTTLERSPRYALQTLEIDGVPYGMFSVVYTNLNPGIVEVYIYLSPASTFNTGMASAQSNIRIGGRSAFLAVIPRTLQSVIVRAAGPGDAVRDAELAAPLLTAIAPEPTVAPATPVPTAQPTVAPTQEPGATPAVAATPIATRDSAGVATPIPAQVATPVSTPTPTATLSPTATPTPTVAPTIAPTPTPTVPPPPTLPTGPVPTMATGPAPTPTASTSVSVSEIVPGIESTPVTEDEATPDIPTERPGIDVSMYEDLGVVEDGYYISPQFGTEVRWDARWTIQQTGDHSAVKSNSVTRTDSVTLMSTQYPEVVVVISIMSSYEFGMSDWVAAMDARNKNDFPDVYTDTSADAGVVVLESRNGLEVYMYNLSTSSDGSVFHETEVRTIPRLTGESLGATDGIQIDGATPFPHVVPEEIEDAVF